MLVAARRPAFVSPRAWLFAAMLGLFALALCGRAEAAFVPPPLHSHVVDTAGRLSAADIADIDRKLEAFRVQHGFEIVAFVTGSLEGENIDDFAYETFNAWKLGEKGKDNGVLLVIAPVERKVRIETGRGVGGALTDLQSNDILRNTLSPLLKEDRIRDAVDQGTTAIQAALVTGTPPEDRPAPQARSMPLWRIGLYVGLGLLVVVLAIVSPGFRRFLFFMLLFGRGGRGGGGGGGSGFSGGGGGSGGGGSSGSY